MSYARVLINKIRKFGLDNLSPSLLPSKVEWKQILAMAEHGILSDAMARTLRHLADQDIEHLTDFPEFLHRIPEPVQWYQNGKPDVPVGTLVGNSDVEFGIRFDGPVFIQVSGLTGFGKSHGVRALLQGVENYNQKNPDKKKVVIVCDRKGTDYGDLASKFGWKHLHVQDSLRAALDPPVGVPLRLWIAIVSSLFCARAGLKYALGTLMSVLSLLFSLLNPQPAQHLLAPDLKAVLDFLKALPKKMFSEKAIYTESLIQQLETFCFSTHPTFSAFKGLDLERLIQDKQSMVLSMPIMEPSWARQFLVDLLIVKVMKIRQARFYRSDSIEIIFVIDEADDDVNAEVEKLFGGLMCPESELFKRGRELGLGAVVVTSSLISVSRIIRENATMHLVFHTEEEKAACEAAQNLSLPPYGELTLKHLAPGECLVKQIGPWPHAVKGKVFYVPHEDLPDRKYDRHPFVPAQSIFQIPAVRAFIEKAQSKQTNSKEQLPSNKDEQIQQYGLDILQRWLQAPYTPLSLIFQQRGKIHYRIQQRIRDYLEKQKWAKFEEPRIGRRSSLLMEPAPQGYEMLKVTSPSGNRGRGGITHRHYAQWIKAYYEQQGLEAFLEWMVPTTHHPVDVAVSSQGEYLVYEICVTSYAEVLSYIELCSQCPDIRKLVIVAGTAKELKTIKALVTESMVHLTASLKITYETIEPYMPKGNEP